MGKEEQINERRALVKLMNSTEKVIYYLENSHVLNGNPDAQRHAIELREDHLRAVNSLPEK